MNERVAKGDKAFEIPETPCDNCTKMTRTQAYKMTIMRSKVRRVWTFCSLSCVRHWVEPMK